MKDLFKSVSQMPRGLCLMAVTIILTVALFSCQKSTSDSKGNVLNYNGFSAQQLISQALQDNELPLGAKLENVELFYKDGKVTATAKGWFSTKQWTVQHDGPNDAPRFVFVPIKQQKDEQKKGLPTGRYYVGKDHLKNVSVVYNILCKFNSRQ